MGGARLGFQSSILTPLSDHVDSQFFSQCVLCQVLEVPWRSLSSCHGDVRVPREKSPALFIKQRSPVFRASGEI